MERKYKYPERNDIIELLQKLLTKDVSNQDYRSTMYDIGVIMGHKLLEDIDIDKKYCLASTAEDADFLSKGILDVLSERVSKLSLVCFWNNHTTLPGTNESTAPIIKRFIDPDAYSADSLIIVKSIISGACVVKTNITDLIQKMSPDKIFILAPVKHIDADKKLEYEFPDIISKKFEYHYLAIDSHRDKQTNEVIPGVGGNVYKLLGFNNQEVKNKYIPNIVKERLFID